MGSVPVQTFVRSDVIVEYLDSRIGVSDLLRPFITFSLFRTSPFILSILTL